MHFCMKQKKMYLLEMLIFRKKLTHSSDWFCCTQSLDSAYKYFHTVGQEKKGTSTRAEKFWASVYFLNVLGPGNE